MLIVGSDRLSLSGLQGGPEGTRHAVDRQGRVLCRTSRARFTWPHLSWESVSGEETACRLCAQVRAAQEVVTQFDPYPSDEPSAPVAPVAPVPAASVSAATEPAATDSAAGDAVASTPAQISPAFAGWLAAPGLFVPSEQ